MKIENTIPKGRSMANLNIEKLQIEIDRLKKHRETCLKNRAKRKAKKNLK